MLEPLRDSEMLSLYEAAMRPSTEELEAEAAASHGATHDALAVEYDNDSRKMMEAMSIDMDADDGTLDVSGFVSFDLPWQFDGDEQKIPHP